jgi:hypothetical protein
MFDLLYRDWGENIITIKDNYGDDIPIINQIKYFINIINNAGEIKLTKVGNLPPAIVREIYDKKILKDYIIETGIAKLIKETDSDSIVVTRIISNLAGLTKKRNNKISLTKNAIKKIESKTFFRLIITTFCRVFNWAYLDRFDTTQIGQFGCNYTLYLLDKYGNEKRGSQFYEEKYYKALFKEEIERGELDSSCIFIRRTFDRFLTYFGFIENFAENKFITGHVKKTKLFNEYIELGKR